MKRGMMTVQDLIDELEKMADKDSLVFVYELDINICYPILTVDESDGIVDLNFALSKPRK